MIIISVLTTCVISAGVPSAIFGLYIRKIEKKADERDKARIKQEVLILTGVDASLALGIAHATEDIRYDKPNGDTTAALEYAKTIKHQLKDFSVEQSVAHLS